MCKVSRLLLQVLLLRSADGLPLKTHGKGGRRLPHAPDRMPLVHTDNELLRQA